MEQLKPIRDKIEQLGGVDFLDEKTSTKIRVQILEKENPGELITEFIDSYGFAMFNNTIGYKTIETVPVAANDLCGIELIFGWNDKVNGVKWNLEQLKEEFEGYFPFAEGYPGDYVCICTKKDVNRGKIYYWAHEEGVFYLIAHSFEKFILSWELAPENDTDESNLTDSWFADDF